MDALEITFFVLKGTWAIYEKIFSVHSIEALQITGLISNQWIILTVHKEEGTSPLFHKYRQCRRCAIRHCINFTSAFCFNSAFARSIKPLLPHIEGALKVHDEILMCVIGIGVIILIGSWSFQWHLEAFSCFWKFSVAFCFHWLLEAFNGFWEISLASRYKIIISKRI